MGRLLSKRNKREKIKYSFSESKFCITHYSKEKLDKIINANKSILYDADFLAIVCKFSPFARKEYGNQ